ncbi:hypothetical protein PGB90_007967 [Kerria lacca]
MVYSVDLEEVKCLICTRIIEEIQKNISKVDAKKMINVGGFRLDDEGNYSEKVVPYMRSEIFLTELMDNICNKMEDYVTATFKKDGKLTVISLLSEDGQMNPLISEVDVVQDPEKNKSLKYYCEDIIDEHNDVFMNEFSKESDDIITKICSHTAQFCKVEEVIKDIKEEL